MEKYNLDGVNGNAYSIIASVVAMMKAEGKSKKEIDEYLAEAKSQDYNNLIVVSLNVVEELNSKYRNGHDEEDYSEDYYEED